MKLTRPHAKSSFAICVRCDHYDRGCKLFDRDCVSNLPESERKPCNIYGHLLHGGGCLADPPLFNAANPPQTFEPRACDLNGWSTCGQTRRKSYPRGSPVQRVVHALNCESH